MFFKVEIRSENMSKCSKNLSKVSEFLLSDARTQSISPAEHNLWEFKSLTEGLWGTKNEFAPPPQSPVEKRIDAYVFGLTNKKIIPQRLLGALLLHLLCKTICIASFLKVKWGHFRWSTGAPKISLKKVWGNRPLATPSPTPLMLSIATWISIARIL